jgi:6-phosphogluconolactonase/glucosamine-6-phosphate isomerase/deaminase
MIKFKQRQLPWQHVHLWVVDERCVSLNDEESNFNLLYKELIKHVDIPYINIHPMPVTCCHGNCLCANILKSFPGVLPPETAM